MRKKKIKPKGERWPPESSEEWHKRIEDLAAAEYEDWLGDCERREYKNSEEYAKRKKLAEEFAKRKGKS